MNAPKVSVVIPAYNEERYIHRVLSSLQRQTFKDFEIIVVDNNCDDNTAKITKSFGARVVKEPTQGMIPARERGFQEARAEIILRTDADTVVPPDWVERMYAAFLMHPEAVAVGGNLLLPIPFGRFIIACYNFFCRIALGHPQLNGPNMAIRKSAWQKIQVCKDDRAVHEDIDLSLHMATQGNILFIHDLYVHYSMRRFSRAPLYTLLEYSYRQIKTIIGHKRMLSWMVTPRH